jgi:hypothetical protein
MANNNDDIKNVLLALNQFTPADAVLTVDSETKKSLLRLKKLLLKQIQRLQSITAVKMLL